MALTPWNSEDSPEINKVIRTYLIPKSNFARSLSCNGKSNLDQTWRAMLAKTKLRSCSGIMSFASSSAALARPIIDGVRALVIYSNLVCSVVHDGNKCIRKSTAKHMGCFTKLGYLSSNWQS